MSGFEPSASTSIPSNQRQQVTNSGKYRVYASSVEKSLRLFENSNDWTDLINALGKLGKAFSSNGKTFDDIPHAALVSKRLSQCLHPALQGGVHLKALEIYRNVFTILGTNNLAKQVHLFTTGLFPLMDHCQIKVKYELLGVFEQFLIPLESNLRPILPGLVAAILHGLESGAEYYDQSLNLLEKVCGKVGHEAFYACFWQASAGNPSVRLPALLFVNLKLEKPKTSLSNLIRTISGCGHATNHMVHALCAISEDAGSTLIQRHFLDFLCAALPLDLNSIPITLEELVEILRRCLFIVLRRDTSLNKRLYQWLLNRPSDTTMLPINSAERDAELDFFKKHALKLVKIAIKNSLSLGTIEVPTLVNATIKYNTTKDSQLQFSEVRVSKLLHYLFTDRQELKILVLDEALLDFLEISYLHNKNIIQEFENKCRSFDHGYFECESYTKNDDEKLSGRRADEFKNNFNALLNSLEPDYLWTSLQKLFNRIYMHNDVDECLSRSPTNFQTVERNHIELFPSAVAFCLETVQLESHGDIRRCYVGRLLLTIMNGINELGCDNFSCKNLVALLILCRQLLSKVNPSIDPAFNEDSKTTVVKSMFDACFQLSDCIYHWYTNDRNCTKTGVIYALTSLFRDFAEFPFCSSKNEINIAATWLINTQITEENFPPWLASLVKVIDPTSWNLSTPDYHDFDVRASTLDLVLYLYIRSIGINRQHLFNRANIISECHFDSTLSCPLLHESLFRHLDIKLFNCSARVLWDNLPTIADPDRIQAVILLLLRIHSRLPNDPSSEVEDTIISDITSDHKMNSGRAIITFHNFWVHCRSLSLKEAYPGILLKPMNRVITVLLNFSSDERIGSEYIQLKALANSWLLDCARHNDLHKILQILTMMLANPATARVSIQYLSIKYRLTNHDIPSMPSDANCITLSTPNDKQHFYHICPDVDAHANKILTIDGNDEIHHHDLTKGYKLIYVTPGVSWVSELNMRLLSPSSQEPSKSIKKNNRHSGLIQDDDKIRVDEPSKHKRTVSDIPQFDDEYDGDSIGTMSLSSTMEHDVLETIQFIVDTVCSENEVQEASILIMNDSNDEHSSSSLIKPAYEHRLEESNGDSSVAQHSSYETCQSTFPPHTENDGVSVVGSLTAFASYTQSTPRTDTIKRIRNGHRRQDSLQESIFSSGAKEVFELPSTTCPGDAKQPLLDETFSHMLLYTENPSIVDLARAEKLLRTVHSMLRGECSLGRSVVAALLFTKSPNSSELGNETMVSKSILNSFYTFPVISLDLVNLLACHYKHIQGEGFATNSEESESDASNVLKRKHSVISDNPQSPSSPAQNEKIKQQTLYELFSTIVLYYLRSYYLNSPTQCVSESDLMISWKCKIAALDCFSELIRILNEMLSEFNSREFAQYVQHLYRQTKAQKVILSLMLATMPYQRDEKDWKMPLAVDIAKFNNGPDENGHFKDLMIVYQRSLLNMTSILIILEYNLNVGIQNYGNKHILNLLQTQSSKSALTENHQLYNIPQNRSTIKDARYSLVELKMFLSVILNALKNSTENYNLWLQFLTGCLPYLDRALSTFVVYSVEQILRNAYEFVSSSTDSIDLSTIIQSDQSINLARTPGSFSDSFDEVNQYLFSDYRISSNLDATPRRCIPNCVLISLESLRSILHFCMLEYTGDMYFLTTRYQNPNQLQSSTDQVSQQHHTSNTLTSNMTRMVGSAIMSIPGTGLLNNLFGQPTSNDIPLSRPRTDSKSAIWVDAQKEMVKRFPSVLSILSDLWRIMKTEKCLDGNISYDATTADEAMCTLMLKILDPIAVEYRSMVINSFGIVWMFRRKFSVFFNDSSKLEDNLLSFTYSTHQISLVDLLLKIRIYSFNTVILSTIEVLKEKIKTSNLDIALLELLHQCLRTVTVEDLQGSWGSLCILFNDIPLSQLPARATFLAFLILVEYVRRCGSHNIVNDKIISKNILEVCQKLLESMNSIVGWQLESVNWLKRTLVVRQDVSPGQRTSDILDQKSVLSAIPSDTSSLRGSTVSLSTHISKIPSLDNPHVAPMSQSSNELKKSASSLRSSLKDNSKKDPSNSIQALFLLAANLAELIDSISKSEDKEKLMPTLQAVWNNTLPYLREKGAKNVRCFLAASQLLGSISSYNYMRSIWKKHALDLIWDTGFFKMDVHALRHWLVTVDNLMTNDKTSFKELLAKINTSTPTALSTLMTSREVEYEIRASHMKRLAYVILSSEVGQYSEQLSEILERINENLRISQAPIIHAQVFACYRILLIRMMPSSFETIWPSLYTEMVCHKSQSSMLRYTLTVKVQVLGHMEQQLSSSSGNLKEDHWMQLYLSASKLLETLCILPSGHVTQFQLCRWVFISTLNSNTEADSFVPFASKISHLLEAKYGPISTAEMETGTTSLFNIKTLTSFRELLPFFHALCRQNESDSAPVDNGVENCDSSNYPPQRRTNRFRDEKLLSGSLSLKASITRIENSLLTDFADHWQL